MRTRTALLSALSGLGLAVLLAACNPAVVKDNSTATNPTGTNVTAIQNAAAGTDTCMTCHGDGTELNEKIQNARDSWLTSTHAKGMTAALLDSTGAVIGSEQEGADSYYANGGGCQVCHTKEGFNRKVAGKYADGTYDESTDFIKHPSSLTCFTCHKPHTNGNFDLVVPPTKAVTLLSGAVYDKEKGSVCASCHMARTPNGDGAQYALDAVKGGSLSSHWGAHHGPQADLLLGKGGAQYTGKTYGNGMHKSLTGANCITCHMPYPDARFGGSANLSGHSFNVVGTVHGAEKANVTGCVTCHDSASLTAANVATTNGHLRANDAYFKTSKGSAHYDKINKLLTALVDPTKPDGDGLLQSAYQLASVAGPTKKIGFSADGRGMPETFSKISDAAATADSAKVRFAKALYNYKFVLEDKSFGVHNDVYASQLLWDSCDDLISLGATTSIDIGTRP